jgi:hypothetical protein
VSRIRRLSKSLARERAIDRNLRGPAAGKFIRNNSRKIRKNIRGFQYGPPNEIYQPGNQAKAKQIRQKKVRRVVNEIRRRRQN